MNVRAFAIALFAVAGRLPGIRPVLFAAEPIRLHLTTRTISSGATSREC
jgi:hypothetical protein